jgi:hypothetical protein
LTGVINMKVLRRTPANENAYRVLRGNDDCLEYKLLKLLSSGKRVVVPQLPLKDARYFERFYQGRQVSVRILSPTRTVARTYFDPKITRFRAVRRTLVRI